MLERIKEALEGKAIDTVERTEGEEDSLTIKLTDGTHVRILMTGAVGADGGWYQWLGAAVGDEERVGIIYN